MALLDNFAWLGVKPIRGEGSRLFDAEGNDYIDLMGGIATTALGHAHPQLVAALTEQGEKLWHISNYFKNAPAEALAERLAALSFADRVVFQNSGAEAVEAAVKLARRFAWHRAKQENRDTAVRIVTFTGGFHGRTMLGISLSDKDVFREGFAPVVPEVVHLPFNDIAAAEQSIDDGVAAVLVEPVQGEAGVHPADRGFLLALRRLCDASGALLVFDEVQTGIGRTGPLFAYQSCGVEPDIMCLGKALGGGLPIAATLTREHIAAALTPGSHGSTFGGNPVACAVALAVLDIVTSLASDSGAHAVAAYLRTGLDGFKRHQAVSEIRVHGALAAADLTQPWKGRAGELVSRAAQAGVLLTACGPDTIRFAPSLIIDEATTSEGFSRLNKALDLPS